MGTLQALYEAGMPPIPLKHVHILLHINFIYSDINYDNLVPAMALLKSERIFLANLQGLFIS
jgi:hypothetical protein